MQLNDARKNEWSSEDASHWEAFLKTQTGERLLPKLAESALPLVERGDVNEILIRNGHALGFAAVVQALFELATQPQAEKPSVENYPALYDDTAWEGKL